MGGQVRRARAALLLALLGSAYAGVPQPTRPGLPPLSAAQRQQLQAAQAGNVAASRDSGLPALEAAVKEAHGARLTVLGAAGIAPLLPALSDFVAAGGTLEVLLSPDAPAGLRALPSVRHVNLPRGGAMSVVVTPGAVLLIGAGRTEVYHSETMSASVRASLNQALTPPARR